MFLIEYVEVLSFISTLGMLLIKWMEFKRNKKLRSDSVLLINDNLFSFIKLMKPFLLLIIVVSLALILITSAS